MALFRSWRVLATLGLAVLTTTAFFKSHFCMNWLWLNAVYVAQHTTSRDSNEIAVAFILIAEAIQLVFFWKTLGWLNRLRK